MNQISEPWVSVLLKIPVRQGQAVWEFPHMLKNHLYQSFVRVRALYSNAAYPANYVMVTSNASEHGKANKVIKNVLAIFEFKKPKLCQFNTQDTTPPINKIPEDIKFNISNADFEKILDFNGWIYVELVGKKKGFIVE